jgi:general secretion pathway protein G
MSLFRIMFRLMTDMSRPYPDPRFDRRPYRRKTRERGFTLTELMVVIFIIGLLATVVLINVLPSQDRSMVTKAQADIATLEQALEMYRLDNLAYPGAAEGLSALTTAPATLADPSRYRRGGYVKRLPEDPWGRPYQYQVPGPGGAAFEILSLGADGAPGGVDENADIRTSAP